MEENIPDVLSDQIDDPNLPDGGSIGSLDCANVDYDDPHLYRPHAFALRHGDDGAQIAYGELHWRVDTITLQFQKKTVAVDPHPDHAHEHDHTHSISGSTGSGPTGSGSDTVTTAINDATTGNVNAGSGTVTTSQPDDATTGTDVAAVSGYGSTSSQTPSTSGVQSGSGYGDHTHDIAHGHDVAMSHTHEHDHTHTAGVGSHTHEHDHTHTIPAHQHSLSLNTGQPNEATTSGVKETDGSSSSGLTHTVTGLEGAGNVITYCDGAGQSAINNITQQVPKINEKDGEAMDSKLDGVHTFHQLDGYGEVYLCWEVDFEESPNVQKCWVQIGVPSGSVTGAVSIGNDTTGRLTDPPNEYAVSTYHAHIGTVNLNERVVQKISSDVSWQPIVMDRVRV
tara:strand:+ start:3008 stop:4189 length:1182 start_codon:yes stop_codon:yes gene_type:complete